MVWSRPIPTVQWRTIRGATAAACIGPCIASVPCVAGTTRRLVDWECRGAIARSVVCEVPPRHLPQIRTARRAVQSRGGTPRIAEQVCHRRDRSVCRQRRTRHLRREESALRAKRADTTCGRNLSAMKSEDVIAAKGRPFTGAEYLASLRDGRDVYVYGERVDDVTTHPAFRNAARSIARLYDALHDAKTKDVLTWPTDTGSGGYTHKFFRAARSREELIAQRDAIAQWARMSYGWMGRSPDYKASLMNTLGANFDFYGKFAGNAQAWYRRAQENVLFMNHAIVNPPVDRSRPVDQVKDVFITIQKDTDAGIYVSGAKVVATSSALTHYNFLGQNAAVPLHDTDLAVMFIAPMNAPGVKLLCRTSYEMTASVMGTPYDYPLSSRFDENDAIFVFDNVFVPWEDVLLHRDLERLKIFFPQSGFLAGYQFQGCTRLAVKLDFLVGVIAKALHAAGSDEFAGDAYGRVKEIVDKIVASSLIYLPSSAKDFKNPTIDRYLARYVRGSYGVEYKERIKVMKLLWDAIGTEFGGRHELYERNYAGNHEDIRIQALWNARNSGTLDAMVALAEQCLADYDEEGWTGSTWLDPDDVAYAPGLGIKRAAE